MRLFALLFGVPASLVFMVVSMGCNWTFLSSLGHTDAERYLLGGLSVSVDILKACAPFWIVSALTAHRRLDALGASVLLGLCLSLSFASALGFAASSRGEVTGGRESINATHDQATKDLARLEQERDKLGEGRLAGVIETDINAAKQEARWKSSKECSNATETESRELCKRIEGLRGELVHATARSQNAADIRAKEQEIKELKTHGAGLELDVQASLLGRFLGLSVGSVQGGLNLLIAVLVEFGAAFGLYFSTSLGQSEKGRVPDVTIMPPWSETPANENKPASPVIEGNSVVVPLALSDASAKRKPRRVQL